MSFWRINLQQRYKVSRHIENEFHIEDPSSLVPAEIIADTIQAHWIPHVITLQNSQCVYFQIRVTRILIPDPLATFVKVVDIKSTLAGTGDYSWHAWRMHFASDLLGPKHRGSYFIGGLAPGFQDVQAEGMNSAGITQMTTNVNNLRAKWTGEDSTTGFNLVIAHKDDSTPTRVSNIGWTTQLTSMRSRKLGHGI